MSTLTKDDVLDVLLKVIDEETGRNVVALGMVQGLMVKNGHVSFALEVPPEKGAAKEPLRKACEDAVYAMPGVLSVTAVLTAHAGRSAEPPAPAAGTRPAARVSQRTLADGTPKVGITKDPVPGVDKIVAVASGKGGVGKSTVALNLALAMKALGARVGLLDADIYGPSVPRMVGLKDKPTSDGKKLYPLDAFGLKVMSMGFLVDEETPMIWRGPMVSTAVQQMTKDVAWGKLDVLVIDLPPGTGDAQLTLAQKVPVSGAVIVSTPQEIALIDARKAVAMFKKTLVPILGMVENMSYFVSPQSGERSFIFGEGGARRTAMELGCDFLGEIPLLIPLRQAGDEGKPLLVTEPDGEAAKIFKKIAERVLDRLASTG
jgi:ATP-binding protein involved in chromosome partitioning